MPDRDDTTSSAARTDAGPDAQQQRPSRRSVLRGAAGAGVAGIAATALAGAAAPALAAASWPAAPAGTKDLDSAEPIVVHVRDARSGEIDVFRGTSQTRVHDRELAARLVRASR
jgi:hypothetical protein